MVCAALQVYIVLSIFTIITYGFNLWSNIKVVDVQDPSETLFKVQAKQNSTWGLIVKIVFLVLYGYLIHVMCQNKLEKYAWIIMFFPILHFYYNMFYSSAIGAIMAIRGHND
tara:strand:- start:1622 stop:1957 length:336 start_codon:yes stop_codon:yes gene_type:complete